MKYQQRAFHLLNKLSMQEMDYLEISVVRDFSLVKTNSLAWSLPFSDPLPFGEVFPDLLLTSEVKEPSEMSGKLGQFLSSSFAFELFKILIP